MVPANDETGKNLRAQWLGALGQIADLELQHRTWLDPANRNPHWSYIEFVCCYPDADQLEDGQQKGWLCPLKRRSYWNSDKFLSLTNLQQEMTMTIKPS
jgi:hypothetical protein